MSLDNVTNKRCTSASKPPSTTKIQKNQPVGAVFGDVAAASISENEGLVSHCPWFVSRVTWCGQFPLC